MSLATPAPDAVSPSIELPREYRLVIDGVLAASHDNATFERRSPADGRLVATYADASVADVERAIDVARCEFDAGSWRETSGAKKAEVFLTAARLARQRSQLLSELVAWEVGKPVAQALGEVNQLISGLEYCAGAVYEVRGEAITQEAADGVALVVHEPVGVVAAITSYNFPINLITAKVPYALAAGCSVVLKASELAAGTAFEVAQLLLDAGLPTGALQVASTTSLDASLALVRSEKVDKIAFTGSTATGRSIMREGAETVKRLTLELGGKGPIIVFEDADLDLVEKAIFSSIFLVAGQVCTAGSRLLVDEAVHDDLVARVRRAAESVRVGHPLDAATTMGPVATLGQLKRVLDHIGWAEEDGSVLVSGGHRITGEGFDEGFFVAPTVFDRVAPGSRLGQEEVFGPVLAISTFRSEQEAVEIANGTQYGLKATVWTRDSARLLRVLRALRHGMVFGNTATVTVPQVGMPFGGYKRSGLGREYGRDGLFSFTETKSVYIKL